MMEKLKSGAARLGISLSPLQLEQFEIYCRELIEWNKRINLTSITDYDDVQVKHFLDSLTAASAMDLKDWAAGLELIDVGTGAGLPGIPLKIAFGDVNLTLLEATVKKTKFLEHIVDELQLKNVAIIASRAEMAAHEAQYREKFEVAVSRAVATLPTLAELMLPFCRLGGICIVQKKGDIRREITQAARAIAVMGGSLREVKPVALPEFEDNRRLVTMDKVKSTPLDYPRRPGMPAKRPIIS
jgi:16S rRNA (guanine527-N7)-methyltransferase